MNRLIFSLLISFPLFASDYVPTNYTSSKEEVRSVFDSLWSDFKNYDNFHCYRRAHAIAYQMFNKGIFPVKAFFFSGDKLKTDLGWWYHVAPMVYYQGEGVVLDRGLLPGATFLKDWYQALAGEEDCTEIKTMDEYRQLKSSVACMYMIAPMYYYTPLSLETLNLESFDSSDLSDMLFSLPARKRDDYLNLYSIELSL